MAGTRPHIFVLAGVNGAGKSSVGGGILSTFGQTWFNPDQFSRELVARTGSSKEIADSAARAYGKVQLEAAIADRTNYAFETTLGGNTIPRLLSEAAENHDIIMIYCGLASAELHIDRVRQRVRHGGHDIPVEKIQERWISSRNNLIGLLPKLYQLQVFDNSLEVLPGEAVPYPFLVLEIKRGGVLHPRLDDVASFEATPDWAKPIVAAACQYQDARTGLIA